MLPFKDTNQHYKTLNTFYERMNVLFELYGSVKVISKKTGLSMKTLKAIKTERKTDLSIELLKKIAGGLGCNFNWLLAGLGDALPYWHPLYQELLDLADKNYLNADVFPIKTYSLTDRPKIYIPPALSDILEIAYGKKEV